MDYNNHIKDIDELMKSVAKYKDDGLSAQITTMALTHRAIMRQLSKSTDPIAPGTRTQAFVNYDVFRKIVIEYIKEQEGGV